MRFDALTADTLAPEEVGSVPTLDGARVILWLTAPRDGSFVRGIELETPGSAVRLTPTAAEALSTLLALAARKVAGS